VLGFVDADPRLVVQWRVFTRSMISCNVGFCTARRMLWNASSVMTGAPASDFRQRNARQTSRFPIHAIDLGGDGWQTAAGSITVVLVMLLHGA
jgi:hypothetical protein